MGVSVGRKRVLPADLTPQPDVYYVGAEPGGERPLLWKFVHREDRGKIAPLYWFSDESQDDDDPLLIPFSAGEVERLLEML